MTRIVFKLCAILLAVLLSALAIHAQQSSLSPAPPEKTAESSNTTITNEPLPKGARIYLASMQNGFETYVAAGLEKKKVPVVLVSDRSKADYELSGVSESDRAGWAKMLFMGSQQTNETASIKVINLKTGNVVFAYSVNKTNSVRGKQSAGEAVAKHINEKIENRYH